MNIAEVAHKFNISKRGVWRRVAEGDLSAPVKIGRCARWFPEDIARFEQILLERRAKGKMGDTPQ